MTTPDPTQGRGLLTKVLSRLKVVRGPDASGKHICWCPFHADGKGKSPHEPNLHVWERGFFCHACRAKGSVRQLAEHLGITVGVDSKSETTYDYHDENRRLHFQVVRLAGKRFRIRRPDGNGGWIWNLKGTRRLIYRLPDLLSQPEKRVFIVEGEKDADRLHDAGLLATTNPGGAGKWRPEHSEFLLGRDVVVLPDNDEPGRRHADQVAHSLSGIADSIKVLPLHDLSVKGDISDWLSDGHSTEELNRLADKRGEWKNKAEASTEVPADDRSRERRIGAHQIIDLVMDQAVELFHDQHGQPYAAVPVREGRQVLDIKSQAFTRWLSGLVWQSKKLPVGRETLATSKQALEGIACSEGPRRHLHVRVAKVNGNIWIDLDGHRAIRVKPGNWEIDEKPPIVFRSLPHQRPLPNPVTGGDPRRLFNLLNLREDDTSLLLLSYLVAAFMPSIPIPALVAHGVQGSGKSTLLRFVKRILDPSHVEVCGLPRRLDDLALIASQSRVLCFDNLSSIRPEMSDALCRVITEAGLLKRALFTDQDTTVFDCHCIIAIAGINLVANRPDLLDRSLIVELHPVSPASRRDETRLMREFEQTCPQILGGLLHALSRALEIEPGLQLSRLPRMADFARWGAAAAEALGMGANEFISAFEVNVGRQNEAAIEASPVAEAVLAFMELKSYWHGTATELLEQLTIVANRSAVNTRRRGWPKDPSWLGIRLREVQTNLLAMGVEVIFEDRKAGARPITLRKIGGNIVTDVTTAGRTPNDDRRMSGLPSRIPNAVMPVDRETEEPDGHDSNDGISRGVCGPEIGEEKGIMSETGEVEEAGCSGRT